MTHPETYPALLAAVERSRRETDPEKKPAPLLHIAAFWIEGDKGDEIADYCSGLKLAKSRGAVVTFSLDTASNPGFQRLMERLDLAEVNERHWGFEA